MSSLSVSIASTLSLEPEITGTDCSLSDASLSSSVSSTTSHLVHFPPLLWGFLHLLLRHFILQGLHDLKQCRHPAVEPSHFMPLHPHPFPDTIDTITSLSQIISILLSTTFHPLLGTTSLLNRNATFKTYSAPSIWYLRAPKEGMSKHS